MLQERINELSSGILNFVGDLIYAIGFYNSERLNSYLNEGKKNWSSTGRYPPEELVFHNIKTNALIIVQQFGIEMARYLYIKVKDGTLIYENDQNKSGIGTAVYEIRKEIYSSTWNLRYTENSLVFETWQDMRNHVLAKFKYDIGEEQLDGETVTS